MTSTLSAPKTLAHRRLNAGLTLVEVSAAMGVTLLFGASVAFTVQRQLRNESLNSSIEMARFIAVQVDENRRSVQSSILDASTDIYSYTYRDDPSTFTNVQTWNTTWGYNLPTLTPFGTPYQVQGRGNRIASCKFTIPFNPRFTPQNSTVSPISGGNYEITVWGEQRYYLKNARTRVSRIKLLNENPRP